MKNDDIKYELWKDFKLSTINIDQYRSFLPSIITRVSILRRIKNRLGIIEFLANDKIMSSLISSRLKKIKNLSVSIMYSFSNGWVTMRGKCGSTWNQGLRDFDMQKCDKRWFPRKKFKCNNYRKRWRFTVVNLRVKDMINNT